MRSYYKDSILLGLLIGILSITLDYIVLVGIDRLVDATTGYGHILRAPRLQLIILAMNIILFRFMMIKWEKPESGRGILLAIVLVGVCYIYNNKSILF
jgi:hypothetical protein